MNFTYEELEKFVQDEWDAMSKDEQYGRQRDCDPTFAQYVLSLISMNDSTPNVYIDFETLNYEVLDRKNI